MTNNSTLSLILPYWKSENKIKALSLLILVIILCLMEVWTSVQLNKVTKNIYDSLENKILQSFMVQIYTFLLLVIFLVCVFCSKHIVVGFLQFNWRKWLTKEFLSSWTKNNAYHHIITHHQNLDNPDQRISQDIKFLSFLSIDLFISFFTEVITLFSFGVILWNISVNFPIEIFKNSYQIPGYLLWIALIYSLIGTYIAIKIGKPLIRLDFLNERYEANFRFSLIRLQEKREGIALYSGVNTEKQYLQESFSSIQQNFYSILTRTFYLNIYRVTYLNVNQLIPLISISPLYFSGLISLGIIMQVASAFNHIMNSLSIAINKFTEIASWKASLKRLIEFQKNINNEILRSNAPKFEIQYDNFISFTNVSLYSPINKKILNNINFKITQGEKISITGSSGTGKSTLVKAIANLWHYTEGNITLPKSKIFFIPQTPYMPISTLKDVITYPGKSVSDSKIIQLLQSLKLHHLSDHLKEKKDWGAILSLGEQQRIAFLRVLIHKPKWIIMDEPTSALDTDLSAICFHLLLQSMQNSTIITISHSQNIIKLHDKNLNAEKWKIKDIAN